MAFWIYGAFLIALASCFFLVPLLRKGEPVATISDEDERRQQNVEIFRQRLQEIEKERVAQLMTDSHFEALKAELELGLLDDVDAPDEQTLSGSPLPQKSHFVLASLFSVTIVAAGLWLYFHLGAYDEQKQFLAMQFAPAEMQQARAAAEQGDMSSLVQQLYTKLKGAPDNVEGWMLLSRSAMNMENYALAAEGFQMSVNSLERRGEDASAVYGLLAQARYFEAGGMSIKARAAVSRALSLNPNEVNAIGLNAIHAFDEKRYSDAVSQWKKLLELSPEHPARSSIEAGINRANGLLGIPLNTDLALNTSSTPGEAASSPNSSVSPDGIRVHVALSDAMRDRVNGSDTVFIFARAVSGPPIPLAASRRTVSELPIALVLDDSMAMTPQLTLSSVTHVNVVARVSKSSQPIAQPGDLQGGVENVQTDAGASVSLVIDEVVR